MMVGQIFTLLESIIIFCTATITTEHLRMSPKRPAYPVLTPQARNYSLSRQRGLITTMMVVSIYSWRTILTGHLRRQRSVVCRGNAYHALHLSTPVSRAFSITTTATEHSQMFPSLLASPIKLGREWASAWLTTMETDGWTFS